MMQDWITEKYLLRNMLSASCVKLVNLYFDSIDGVEVKKARLGEVVLIYDPQKINSSAIEKGFSELGFSVVTDSNESLVENIKVAAIELIHHANNMSSLIRNSDYISDRVQVPYDKLSKVFSSVTGTALEKRLENHFALSLSYGRKKGGQVIKAPFLS